jgi:hypothetical protein
MGVKMTKPVCVMGFLVCSTFVGSTVLWAQSVASPDLAKTVTDVAAFNPLLGAVYLSTMITLIALALVWKQMSIIAENAINQGKMISDFNSRPCVQATKAPINPNLIAEHK